MVDFGCICNVTPYFYSNVFLTFQSFMVIINLRTLDFHYEVTVLHSYIAVIPFNFKLD